MYHDFSCILARMGLWNDTGTVLLAVSGGIDSMCMADLFRRTGLPFAIAHCNFHLRPHECDEDEALVRTWAETNGIRFHRQDFDTESFASTRGISIEMAARELRYRWFAELCIKNGYTALCVAHNANDNAETLFLNIVRGTGIKGLSGMGYESAAPYSSEDSPVRLLRPLLSFTRKQIEGYVRACSIPYSEDSTNAQTDYTRNKIRHLVFPVLEQINPSFIKTVSDEMGYFAQAEAMLDSYYRTAADTVLSSEGGDESVDLKLLLRLEHWEYVLYRLMDGRGFNSASVRAVTSLLKSDRTIPGKKFRSATHVMAAAGGRLIFRPALKEGLRPGDFPGNSAQDVFTVVRGEGSYRCNGTSFSVSVTDRACIASLKQPSGTLLFDASLLKFPFVCRVWRDGDWFVPFGMKGRKKVSDFFTDLKYDFFRKQSAVMVADTSDPESDGHRVAAVLGERIDDRYRITDATAKVLVLRRL